MTDALLDLQDQLFADWEAIAMNDCSPDDSLAVAQRFADADSRIRIVSHEENRGLSAARNAGLAAAYGRYVWFPDPDDRYDFTLLQSVYDSLQQQETPVVMVRHVDEFYDAAGAFKCVEEFLLGQKNAHMGKTKGSVKAKLTSHCKKNKRLETIVQPLVSLSISFRPVVCFAQHLTIGLVRCPAFAPCGNVIGIHFLFLVQARSVRFRADCAKGAVRFPASPCGSRLLFVHTLHSPLAEHSDI